MEKNTIYWVKYGRLTHGVVDSKVKFVIWNNESDFHPFRATRESEVGMKRRVLGHFSNIDAAKGICKINNN